MSEDIVQLNFKLKGDEFKMKIDYEINISI